LKRDKQSVVIIDLINDFVDLRKWSIKTHPLRQLDFCFLKSP
jgi:hypothetical protein